MIRVGGKEIVVYGKVKLKTLELSQTLHAEPEATKEIKRD